MDTLHATFMDLWSHLEQVLKGSVGSVELDVSYVARLDTFKAQLRHDKHKEPLSAHAELAYASGLLHAERSGMAFQEALFAACPVFDNHVFKTRVAARATTRKETSVRLDLFGIGVFVASSAQSGWNKLSSKTAEVNALHPHKTERVFLVGNSTLPAPDLGCAMWMHQFLVRDGKHVAPPDPQVLGPTARELFSIGVVEQAIKTWAPPPRT